MKYINLIEPNQFGKCYIDQVYINEPKQFADSSSQF